MKKIRPHSLLPLASGLWLAALGLGFYLLHLELYTPVQGSRPVETFPATSLIPTDPDRPSLVFFAHPHCPCSQASLHELQLLAEKLKDQVAFRIVFVLPPGVPDGWEKGDLLNAAEKIPGAQIFHDAGGEQSRLFGVKGSGETLLYDNGGRLLFHGGITAARGMEGSNPGSQAIVSLILNHHSPVVQSPAYGCSLLGENKGT